MNPTFNRIIVVHLNSSTFARVWFSISSYLTFSESHKAHIAHGHSTVTTASKTYFPSKGVLDDVCPILLETYFFALLASCFFDSLESNKRMRINKASNQLLLNPLHPVYVLGLDSYSGPDSKDYCDVSRHVLPNHTKHNETTT